MTLRDDITAKLAHYEEQRQALEDSIILHELDLRIEKGQLSILKRNIKRYMAELQKIEAKQEGAGK